MKVPTAKKFLEEYPVSGYDEGDYCKSDVEDFMMKFAKLHVKAALKEALGSIPCLGSSTDIPSYEEVEDAVLNCYSLDKIK